MTIGEISGLIAALAFVALVVFLIINLRKTASVFEEIEKTVGEVNETIAMVNKNVNNISDEVEGLLNKANDLVADINQKVEKTDPLFTAIGDIGTSVSDVNDSCRNLVESLASKSKKTQRKRSSLSKVGAVVNQFKKAKSDRNTKASVPDITVTSDYPDASNGEIKEVIIPNEGRDSTEIK